MEKNNLLYQNVVLKIKEEASFVGQGIDSKGQPYEFENYSTTVTLFPSWLDKLEKEFPNYKIYHLYSDKYIVGFNKPFRKK